MINRSVQPQGPPQLYKTYRMDPYTRPATCVEVDCPRMRNGWRSRMDVTTVDGQKQANWIRLHSRRSFTFTQSGPVVTFTFAAGQTCFGKHRVTQVREPLLRVVGGDFRGNPMGIPTRVLRPADWIDDFATHQAALSDAQKKG